MNLKEGRRTGVNRATTNMQQTFSSRFDVASKAGNFLRLQFENAANK
jgi:hypothetical protein